VSSERRKGGDSMNRKSLVVSIISTFCLTSIIFLIIPVHSYTPYTYDPWLDVNDDGKINLVDTFTTDLAYGTTGDPTKPVTVTNLHDYELQTGTINFSASNQAGSFIPTIYVGGYSRISILLGLNSTNSNTGEIITYLLSINWTQDSSLPSTALSSDYLGSKLNLTKTPSDFGWPSAYVTETKAPYCHLCFYAVEFSAPVDWWVTVNYAVYLRNE
jgi:hypothetical protein